MKNLSYILAAGSLALAFAAGAIGAGMWSAGMCFGAGGLSLAALLVTGANAYEEGYKESEEYNE